MSFRMSLRSRKQSLGQFFKSLEKNRAYFLSFLSKCHKWSIIKWGLGSPVNQKNPELDYQRKLGLRKTGLKAKWANPSEERKEVLIGRVPGHRVHTWWSGHGVLESRMHSETHRYLNKEFIPSLLTKSYTFWNHPRVADTGGKTAPAPP